ncbi:MAG: ATP-binding protein [Deltaproteobacteria bacterium]|nr:ATP-binding protein [Deltaproteobacteria bacterium]
MLARHSITSLNHWYFKKNNRKPLLIRGARQVGKTTLIRMFAKGHDLQLIEINMEKPWKFKNLIKGLDPKKVVEAIEFELNVDINPAKSLVFFDEVQSCPEVLPLMRYFFEEAPEYGVVVTGSLIDFILNTPEFSVPVGRIELLYLHPLSFEEFLLAIGEKKVLEWIKNYKFGQEVSETIHAKCQSLIKTFLIVGGMPEAVYAYSQNRRFKETEKIKSLIVDTFRLDFNKYQKKTNIPLLTSIYDAIPRMVGKKIIYSHLNQNYKSHEISLAVNQLSHARVVSKVYHTSANGLPLSGEKKENNFKIISLDCGILLSQLKLNPLDIEVSDKLHLVSQGDIAEQFIGQQLMHLSEDYSEPELYYWNREQKASSAEVDYVISSAGKVIPVEVKAGKTGSLKSLHLMIHERGLDFAVRFNSDYPSLVSEKRKTLKGDITYRFLSLPHYLVQRLHQIIQDVPL